MLYTSIAPPTVIPTYQLPTPGNSLIPVPCDTTNADALLGDWVFASMDDGFPILVAYLVNGHFVPFLNIVGFNNRRTIVAHFDRVSVLASAA